MKEIRQLMRIWSFMAGELLSGSVCLVPELNEVRKVILKSLEIGRKANMIMNLIY